MINFATFEREKWYFRPSTTHMDVFVSLKNIPHPAMDSHTWTYKLKTFCSIPVILFQCKSMDCNILVHLNYPGLVNLNATSWLKADCSTFMLFLSDTSVSKNVVCAKTIQLCRADSDRIRNACSNQNTLSSQTIENLVGVIYEQGAENIWPMKPRSNPV
jgi:hypothetical protein